MIKKVDALNKQRTKYIFSLVHGKPMLHGMPHEVFRKCGKKTCRCAEGKLHGPYNALSVNVPGKKKIVMIKKKDISIVLKEARRYHYFQKKLSSIRKINKEIDALLIELRKERTKEYSKIS